MARVIEIVARNQPKAIALDVLYTDATEAGEDAALASAVARAGNVVAAAQLNAEPDGPSEWLGYRQQDGPWRQAFVFAVYSRPGSHGVLPAVSASRNWLR